MGVISPAPSQARTAASVKLELKSKLKSESKVKSELKVKSKLRSKSKRKGARGKPTGSVDWTQLLKRGSRPDLPRFLSLLESKPGDALRIVAYRATRKWGTLPQQQQVYLKALSGKGEAQALAAMRIFRVQTPALRRALCDWVERGRWQTTRLTAARQLSTFPTRHVVGCLILALREQFQPEPPDRHFVKYMAGILSLGIGFWAMHRQRKKRRQAFHALLYKLSERLRQMTGVDFGNDYHSWLDWGLRQGYTVGDMTLVQLLFSPYKVVRERAQRTAVALLDERGEQLRKRHASDKDGGAALRIALAHLLQDAGLLARRRIPLASQPTPVAPHSKRPPGSGCSGCQGIRYGCGDCDDCDVGRSGPGGVPASWILVALFFWLRRRRRRRRQPRRRFATWLLPLFLAGLTGLTGLTGLASSAQARSTQGTREARLAARIRTSRFNSDGERLARKLARLRTPAARAALLALLTELEPYHRPSAVAGLLALKDPTLAGVLLSQLRTGFWVQDPIRRGIIKNMPIYYPAVEQAFRAQRLPKDQAWAGEILALIARSREPRGRTLLQGLVTDKGSSWRQKALELLMTHWVPQSDAFIRRQVDAPKVGRLALRHVLRTGSAADLPLFGRLARQKGSGDRVIAGFRGIHRFGDDALKRQTFEAELRGKSARRAHAAMLTFTVRSPALRVALCRVALKGKHQHVRTAAVLQLVHYDTRQIIPCLVPFLREDYGGREGSSLLHGFVAFMSLGLSVIAGDAHKAASIKGFTAAKSRVGKRLARFADTDHGASYWRWRDWAAEQGFTVEGRNLLQVLLSADPKRRKRAQARALALLGFADVGQLLSRHPLRGRSHSLALVAQLQARGHLRDEPLPKDKKLAPDAIHLELTAHARKMRRRRSGLLDRMGCGCGQGSPGDGGGDGGALALLLGIWLWLRRRRLYRAV